MIRKEDSWGGAGELWRLTCGAKVEGVRRIGMVSSLAGSPFGSNPLLRGVLAIPGLRIETGGTRHPAGEAAA